MSYMSQGYAIRPGSWNKPLNFFFHVNWAGEPRIPFALYVQPDLQQNVAYDKFPQFCLLPIELHRLIMYFCDGPTLFQLMQISVTRYEAKKLFWADPDTWYRIDGRWIRFDGTPGSTRRDVGFLAYVERLNVCFDEHGLRQHEWIKSKHLEEMVDALGGPDYCNEEEYFANATDQVLQSMKDEIQQFWRYVQTLCPRLTHVLISDVSNKMDSGSTPSKFIAHFLKLCPVGISLSLSLDQRISISERSKYQSYRERNLWRLTNMTDTTGCKGQWEKVLTNWTPRIVLLPPKKFQGPVGAFQRFLYRLKLYCMREHGAEILLVDTIERYHFHGRHVPFVCFAPNCEEWFKEPGEYFLHAIGTAHHMSATPPGDFKMQFELHSQELKRLKIQNRYEPYEPYKPDANEPKSLHEISTAPSQKLYDEDQAMIYELEKEDLYYIEHAEKHLLLDEREINAKRAFLHQLQHDPSYTAMKPRAAKSLWDLYKTHLHYIRDEDISFRDWPGVGTFHRAPFDEDYEGPQGS